MAMSFFQRTRPQVKSQSFLTTGRQKKVTALALMGFYSHCNFVLEAMGCFYHFCCCQEVRPSLSVEDIQRGTKKR